MAIDPIVVVGGGESAACAIAAIRSEGCNDEIAWICEEPVHAYERPTLSKLGLSAEAPPPPLAVEASLLHDPTIDIRLATSVTHIAASDSTITLSSGQTIRYSRLLLATGAEPRTLDIPGRNPDRWHTLRLLSDVKCLRQYLRPDCRIAIVGAGLIGLEVAAAARLAGADVTVIESQRRPLARVLPAEIAEIVLQQHRDMGVQFHFDAAISVVEATPNGEHIQLKSGHEILADAVLVAIGSVPRLEIARDAGITTANGIVVDELLRTSHPDIWASGDCCAFPLNGQQTRLESWEAARLLGDIAGRNIAGRALPAHIIPWFWSDQYDLGIQGIGLPPPDATVVHRNLGTRSALAFSLCREGRLRAVHGIGQDTGIAKYIKRSRQFVAERAICDPLVLRDPNQPIWSAFRSLAIAS